MGPNLGEKRYTQSVHDRETELGRTDVEAKRNIWYHIQPGAGMREPQGAKSRLVSIFRQAGLKALLEVEINAQTERLLGVALHLLHRQGLRFAKVPT